MKTKLSFALFDNPESLLWYNNIALKLTKLKLKAFPCFVNNCVPTLWKFLG